MTDANRKSVEIKNLDLNFGAVKVLRNLNLDVYEGEFLVLLGSSGCGKSTLLNCIAGLLEITEGQIWIKGTNVTWAEPSARGIGMVFQSYALYPQMTVEGNMSFGLKNARVPKPQIKERVARAAEVLQIEPLLKRKPSALSGGQRQRVAIGRALVRDVDVFLFDEPLSNLDAKLRADLRVELKQLHHRLKNTMIYVTHDQVEAMTLASRIAIMKDGMIQQLASPEEIYSRPANLYVADFIGSPAMNLVKGTVSGNRFTSGALSIPLDGYDFTRPAKGEAWFGIRPEHILVGDDARTGDAVLDLEAEVVEPLGSDTLILTSLNGGRFWLRTDGQTRIRSGDHITVGLRTADASLFDTGDEARL
ncbi:ATP-binding cassette domain-containing protein [Silicimonas algicola]|uniref:Carbohydrate ABC transporter ATP-binding protein (CUT1 family) n=1 Tax=Silicimonas algicola TaxID=1826607 RepID=A0A316GA13_9RHOB|nr:ATP-binding cassette domain-containing protein [Silicimonas algicola]AZQ67786.1 ATP-binding cassette domain-containing protein [Silicimonas algicola]PWK57799.1 carbohydrate ABC transporter ATP-binding protein (CUT1 family) [Silicimonas algicola]